MDKTIQRIKKIIYVFILSTIIYGANAQCDEEYINTITVDSCERVVMSSKKFTEFYVAKRNLEIIGDSIPGMQETIDSLTITKEKADSLYHKEIETLNGQKKALFLNLDKCADYLLESELRNERLTNQNRKLRKKNGMMFGLGAGAGGLLIAIIKVLL